MPRLIMEFQKTHKDVDFKVDTAVRFPFDRSGLGENITEVFDDMSGAKFAERYGYAPLNVLISGGARHVPDKLQALGVFVHPSNPLQSLSMEQLEQIYSKKPRDGKLPITTWGQLGLDGEWANRPIIVCTVNRFGGAPGGFFNYHVLGDTEPRDDAREYMHSAPIIGAVAAEPNAIGYVAMVYVNSTVKALAISPRGRSGAVLPTEENERQLRYPLGIPFYLSINLGPGKTLDPYLRDFVALVLSPAGQKIISDDGYLPLPEEAVIKELSKLN